MPSKQARFPLRACCMLAFTVLAGALTACGGSSAVSGVAGSTVTPTPSPAPTPAPTPSPTPGAAPKATVLTSGLSSPWGMAFLPDGRMLVTQKAGRMVIVSANGTTISAPFSPALPNLVSSGQGGLLDVALDPDFDLTTNPRIYWTFSESGTGGSGTAVARRWHVGIWLRMRPGMPFKPPKLYTGKCPRWGVMATSVHAWFFAVTKPCL